MWAFLNVFLCKIGICFTCFMYGLMANWHGIFNKLNFWPVLFPHWCFSLIFLWTFLMKCVLFFSFIAENKFNKNQPYIYRASSTVDSSWLNRPLKQVFWSRKPITEMVEITRWIFCTLQIFACRVPTIHQARRSAVKSLIHTFNM